jgi:hypothetical protein
LYSIEIKVVDETLRFVNISFLIRASMEAKLIATNSVSTVSFEYGPRPL